MIKKIDFIRSMAVFQDYKWDSVFVNNATFKKINILYGRNYSGKTTLSRIFRALETGRISTNYDNPQFQVTWEGGKTSTPEDLISHNETLRVFNEDFVRENLGFLMNTSNSDGIIKPFAVLGVENVKIENEIKKIRDELGCSVVGEETGLYQELQLKKKEQDVAAKDHKEQYDSLAKKKNECAVANPHGIKYQSNRYGDQNYDKRKLEKDIETVLGSSYQPLKCEIDEKQSLESRINEVTKDSIPSVSYLIPDFCALCEQVKELVERKIGASEKIQELMRNQELNAWVKKGYEWYSERTTCPFCGQEITSERRNILHRHFDEETKKLEEEIEKLKAKLEESKKYIQSGFIGKQDSFYFKYQADVENLKTEYSTESDRFLQSMELLLKQLEQREQAITVNFSFVLPEDVTSKIEDILSRYKALCKKSNEYTTNIEQEKTQAKEKLRLDTVRSFCDTIGYTELLDKIKQLEEKKNETEENVNKIQTQINENLAEIGKLRGQLEDESKGAEEVNNYLNHVLGNRFLSLVAISEENIGQTQVRFEIQRDGKPAHNLSEGECSLIAFCYFMAKLQDINTKDTQPIIWIDDPISSLDGNHVFFIYSLIRSEIVKKKKYKQLFISTHNLEFLKYLMNICDNEEKKKNVSCYLIERSDTKSSFKEMPEYLKKYTTEFIYLFKQIYICAKAEQEDDGNFESFYNFGNNARKFLEIYRFYRFPDSTSGDVKKLSNVFGNDIETFFIDRVNNEASHFIGSAERGARPIEIVEMQKVAQCIINGIRNADQEQYSSFLKSIGENPEEEHESTP